MPLKQNIPGAVIIEGHVQGLSNTRSLGEAGIPVYVVDKEKCIARHSKYCTKFFLCPDFNSEEFVTFMIDLAKSENIPGWVLIPSNDHAVYTISKHKKDLEKYYKVITPELEIVSNIYDKSRLLSLAENLGLPIPITQYFSASDEVISSTLKFPVLTKGRNGLSFFRAVKRKAFLANNEKELRSQLNYIKEKYPLNGTFTQELISSDGSNKTISFTAFCIKGEIKTYWMGVKLREHPIQFGTATFAKSVYVENCYQQSIPLLKALNYTGVCEVEFLLDPRTKEYKLIEINARTWLWVGLAKACGVDYTKIIYDYLNEKKIIYPQSYKKDIVWINPVSDLIYSILSLIKGKLSFKNYFTSVTGTKITNALFTKNDMKPGFSYMFKIFYFLKNR
jgi:D-aspartate ligase